MSLEQNPEVIVDDILLVNHFVEKGDRLMVMTSDGTSLGRFGGHEGKEKFDLNVNSLRLTETFNTPNICLPHDLEIDRSDVAGKAESLSFLQEKEALTKPERTVDISGGFIVFRFIEE